MSPKQWCLLLFVALVAALYQWSSYNQPYLRWKIWQFYIWNGYYTFMWHYKYVYAPQDGLNVSAEFRSLSTSAMIHRILFPPPIDEHEWLAHFQWVTDDAMRVYSPINPKCSIVSSSHSSSEQQLPSLWILGDELLSDLEAYNSSSSWTLLMVHGGAFVLGSGSTYYGMACHLSNYLKMRILFVDYELAPKYAMPTPVNTIYSAYMFLLNDMKMNAQNIIFHGDSAGGILTIWTLQQIVKEKVAQPFGAILMSPWFDITCSTPSWMHKYDNFDAIPSRKNTLRNAFWMMSNSTETLDEHRIENADLYGLQTKFIVIVGKNEVLYEEAMSFKNVCVKKFEIEWTDIIIEHGIHDQALLIGLFPEAEQTMMQLVRTVDAEWISRSHVKGGKT